MSIALIVTRGFGNGTLLTTIKNVVTAGYTAGAAVIPSTPPPKTGIIGNQQINGALTGSGSL